MSQTTNTRAQESAGTGGDPDREISYRPVSGAAICALVLGLLSPLAIFWKLLWLLPLLGVLVSTIALRGIDRSDGALAGRGLAITGLLMSLVIGSMVLAGEVTRKQLVVAQGTPWGMKWCELLLEGRTEEALELKQGPNVRRPFTSLEKYYAENDSAKARLAEFREEPLIKLLTTAPEGSRVVPGKVVGVDRRPSGEYGVLRNYELHPPASGPEGMQPISFLLEVDKAPARGVVKSGWYVRGYELDSGNAAADR